MSKHTENTESAAKPRIFLIVTNCGQTVQEHANLRAARSSALREFGTRGFRSAKAATMGELVEHKRAGGWIPVGVRAAVEAEEVRMRAALAKAQGGESC